LARTSKARTIAATPHQVWEVIEDPHHMPRWWPGVKRVEDVSRDHFTQVFTTKRGRSVRMDFRVLTSDPPGAGAAAATIPGHRAWQQEVAGTPFERVLSESIYEVLLEQVDQGTKVTIAQEHRLKGYSRTGGLVLRRAARNRLSDALDGLARICG
jgi:uncharacterized protein YndB with AHSA1/START domain